ncbi:hypothetical protein LSH36_3g05048 [Paralvinella palmiformis]|uniref:2-oxo-4-hydroxy-4-carboxy-5-ureidoimidazoline decarboxylase n=1 Tax=Paralvinella palmiformis TaxID=53620 RepID=A0AAD9KFE8_9ANNE|nr:hypothetical protein LSH36_3g05048 [Paralvinella palmiformis]
MATLDIFTINSMDYVAFISKFGNVVESNPFVAAAVWTRRPFSDFNSIYQAFCDIFENLPTFDLGSNLELLSMESRSEQKSAGLQNLSSDEKKFLSTQNARYRSMFHFPLVMCARDNGKEAIFKSIITRMKNSKEEDFTEAERRGREAEERRMQWHSADDECPTYEYLTGAEISVGTSAPVLKPQEAPTSTT